MRLLLFYCLLIGTVLQVEAGTLVAGPMQGHTTTQSTNIWLLVQDTESVDFILTQQGKEELAKASVELAATNAVDGHQTVQANFEGLTEGSNYQLEVLLDGESVIKGHELTLAKSAGDFSFLFGSCAMYRKGVMPAISPVGSFDIFNTMRKEETDFMIWLGDNVYYEGKDTESYENMFRRNLKVREDKRLNGFLRSMPHYAIWDDHDYGPNNSGKEFSMREEGLKVFQEFWANPSYGNEETPGIFTQFSYADADFFMVDVRYHRDEAHSKGGRMLGEEQMKWLKEALLASKANYKFIAYGTQVLISESRFDSYYQYKGEREELINFLEEQDIEGVVFLSGDRHFAELHKRKINGSYVYDVTSSPLTSFVKQSPWRKELSNTSLVKDSFVGEHNYGRMTITGPPNKRACKVELLDKKGNPIWSFDL